MISHGDLKSLCSFWTHLAQTKRYQQYVEAADIQSFLKRAENEGLTFLTTTLPNFGKALDLYFSTQSYTVPFGFVSKWGIPLFLGKAVKCSLEGDSVAVDCVRQLSYVFYKLEVPYESEKQMEFLDNFCTIDSNLASYDDTANSGGVKSDRMDPLIGEAARLIKRILCNVNPLDIRPRHGTGATACHTKSYEKYHRLRYFPQLDDVFSYSDYFFYSFTHLADRLGELEESEVGNPEARVVLVPKDSRGPRVISCEPAEFMFIQQGLMKLLYRTLETHPLTRGQINFSDQSINRSLARDGSLFNHWATLDMKDASDRVSLSLVRRLFPENWVTAFEACRSTSTVLPDGRVVKLNKFAPMGSACCFPVEAMVFWALARAATHKHTNVYVYGDDIICDGNEADQIIDTYQRYGLLANRTKCYTWGPFRESCGGDYHNGYDVTPVKLKKIPNMSRSEWIAGVELANLLLAKFGVEAVPLLDFLEGFLGPLPRSPLPIPGTVRLECSASNDVFFRRRFNVDLQREEYRIRQLTNRSAPFSEPDWAELLRFELESNGSHLPLTSFFDVLSKDSDKRKPGEYSVDHSERLKWSWVWLG